MKPAKAISGLFAPFWSKAAMALLTALSLNNCANPNASANYNGEMFETRWLADKPEHRDHRIERKEYPDKWISGQPPRKCQPNHRGDRGRHRSPPRNCR